MFNELMFFVSWYDMFLFIYVLLLYIVFIYTKTYVSASTIYEKIPTQVLQFSWGAHSHVNFSHVVWDLQTIGCLLLSENNRRPLVGCLLFSRNMGQPDN